MVLKTLLPLSHITATYLHTQVEKVLENLAICEKNAMLNFTLIHRSRETTQELFVARLL